MKLFELIILALFLLFIASINSCESDKIEENTIEFDIPAGFVLDDLYMPSRHGQGSWVSITQGPDSLLYTCDQYGKIYKFKIPDTGESIDVEHVDSIDLNMGFAQGLLWAFNSLYVVVVKEPDEDKPDDPSTGVYRLRDLDDDGKLESITKILDLDGRGEHGPHTLRVSPDGRSLYMIAGNFNSVPDHFSSRLPKNWGEDNLFAPYLDARGHATDLTAPGGWLAKTDPNGNHWELIAAGFRNPFSFGFNDHGELFAYDADMEWDFGMPWYRPTRILHVTSGAEFGWRTGSGKWPVYYPDNLPAVENMAQGSPTAVIMGKNLNFPSKYRNGLFACDWSFGTIYFVDLKEDGSSYKGDKTEFLTGTPLPISNGIAGSDGHLYFLTGGRRLDSHLFRLRYIGQESTEKKRVDSEDAKSLRELRKSLEELQIISTESDIPFIWDNLDHHDRFVRYAARMALEHLPLEKWENRLWDESKSGEVLAGALAYARSESQFGNKIVDKLQHLNWDEINEDEKLGLLRIYSLLSIRNGEPSEHLRNKIIHQLSSNYPNQNWKLNRELSQVLLYLEAPQALEKTIDILRNISSDNQISQSEILSEASLERSEQYGPQIVEMIKAMPPTEAIHYVTILSHIEKGWTKDLRVEYFEWFLKALDGKGGESYKPFIDNIRARALENVPDGEKQFFQNLAGFYSPTKSMGDLPQAIGPGKDYNLYDLGDIILWDDDKLEEYNGRYEEGKRAYEAALCSSCHRLRGEGSTSGPDLTNINTRFSKNDIVKSVLSPNEEISDQYAFTIFSMSNGQKISGRVVGETENYLEIYQSPFDITVTTKLKKTDIIDRSLSPLSPMPVKLLNRLNEKEVKDLIVYLLAGGDPNHEHYER